MVLWFGSELGQRLISNDAPKIISQKPKTHFRPNISRRNKTAETRQATTTDIFSWKWPKMPFSVLLRLLLASSRQPVSAVLFQLQIFNQKPKTQLWAIFGKNCCDCSVHHHNIVFSVINFQAKSTFSFFWTKVFRHPYWSANQRGRLVLIEQAAGSCSTRVNGAGQNKQN